MSDIHDQAMQYIYQQVLERLLKHMSQAQRASMQLLIQRLLVAAGGVEYIGQFQLLVVHGEDRRSAHLLACLRAAQLTIALRAPATFRLRVVVAALPAISQKTLINHERSFGKLFMQDDARVELLMIEGQAVVPFRVRPTMSIEAWAQSRQALLLFGHLTAGQPEAMFGSRLHLQLANAFCLVLENSQGASALITLIPERQRLLYLAWSRRCLRLAGESGLHGTYLNLATLAEALGWLQALADAPLDAPRSPATMANPDSPLRVIAVDDLLQDRLDDSQLQQMLGVHLEPSRPQAALMAYFDLDALLHLRQLRGRQQRKGHKEGRLGLAVRDRAHSTQASDSAQARFLNLAGLTEQQLVCLIHAPFADHGCGLEGFVEYCHPGMRVALPYLHRALQGKTCPEPVQQWLMDISGLSLAQLKAIYARRMGQPARRVVANLARRDLALRLQASARAVPQVAT